MPRYFEKESSYSFLQKLAMFHALIILVTGAQHWIENVISNRNVTDKLIENLTVSLAKIL